MVALEIICPECGHAKCRVKERATQAELLVTVSKCPWGGCDMIVINEYGQYEEHYEDFNELKSNFHSRFDLLEKPRLTCG